MTSHASETTERLVRQIAGRRRAPVSPGAMLALGLVLGVGIGGVLLAAGLVIALDDIARWLGEPTPWLVPFRVRQGVLYFSAAVAGLNWLLLAVAPVWLALVTTGLTWRWIGPGTPAAFATTPLSGRQRIDLIQRALAQRYGVLMAPLGLMLALAPLSTVAFTVFWQTIYTVMPPMPQNVYGTWPAPDWYFRQTLDLAAPQLLAHSGFALALAALLLPARAVGLVIGAVLPVGQTGRISLAALFGVAITSAILNYLTGPRWLVIALVSVAAIGGAGLMAWWARTFIAAAND